MSLVAAVIAALGFYVLKAALADLGLYRFYGARKILTERCSASFGA
jgi:hypothetical protein